MHIRLTSILEGKFKNRKNQIHLFDVPMFSVYADANLPKKDMYNIKRGEKRIKSAFENARQQIHSMGFASMHANVLIKDLSEHTSGYRSELGAWGLAYHKGKYMEIDSGLFSSTNKDYLAKTIVHEWAHLWMFNNSKEFKNSVNTLYNKLVSSGAEKIKPEDIEPLIMKKFSHTDELSLIRLWKDGFDSLFSNKFYAETGTRGPFETYALQQQGKVIKPEELNWIIVKLYSTDEGISKLIVGNLEDTFENACKQYRFNPTPDIIEKVKDIIKKYVVPKAMELAKNETLYNELIADSSKMYDLLWVNNELKPDDVSITKIFKQLYLAREFQKTKKDMFAANREFRGADNSFHRKYLKNIHNWVNDYGMSNNDELWATGIEEFFKLPLPHRKAIVKIMMNMGAS